MTGIYDFKAFTEQSYESLLDLAIKQYRFISYRDYDLAEAGRHILWRHDIDYSVHRAYRLAVIEHQRGVKSTYFVNFHSEFYNVYEKEITVLLRKIAALGHEFGLHFDPSYYDLDIRHPEQLETLLTQEKLMLEQLLGVQLHAFSFHNPTVGNWVEYTTERLAGMVNTYAAYFKEHYDYCSDSNGYWRFKNLKEVLTLAERDRLQVLTHPEWWTPEPMSPRDRITRCIEGRARKQHEGYDDFLALHGRLNIK